MNVPFAAFARVLVAVCVLCTGCAITQTFVVDAQGGTGVHFTSISAAIASVPDGAVLLVQPGSYGSFTIQNKAIRILGQPGVRASLVSIRHTQAQQAVVLAGFTFTVTTATAIDIDDAQGLVVIEDVSCVRNQPHTAFFASEAVRINESAHVVLSGLSVGGLVKAIASEVVLNDSGVAGNNAAGYFGGLTYPSSAALAVSGGRVQVAGCTLQGGNAHLGSSFGPGNQPAVTIAPADTELRVFGTTTLAAGSTSFAAIPACITGSGSVQLDPQATLTSPTQLPSTLTIDTRRLPELAAMSGQVGGQVSASALGPIGDLTILLIGLPAAAQLLFGVEDPLWLDPMAYEFAAMGVPVAAGAVQASVAVPNQVSLRGFALSWQSVSLTGGLRASNPAVSLVH